jgi:hypothetical protein
MPEPRKLTLADIADGAAEELFAAALAKVLENIEDPNTDSAAARRIDLRFTFSADEDRRVGDVVITTSTKLAIAKGVRVGVYFGKHDGARTAVEAPKQEEMFTSPAGRPRVVAGA